MWLMMIRSCIWIYVVYFCLVDIVKDNSLREIPFPTTFHASSYNKYWSKLGNRGNRPINKCPLPFLINISSFIFFLLLLLILPWFLLFSIFLFLFLSLSFLLLSVFSTKQFCVLFDLRLRIRFKIFLLLGYFL